MDARWRREDEWFDETVENKGSVASIIASTYTTMNAKTPRGEPTLAKQNQQFGGWIPAKLKLPSLNQD